MDRGRPGRCQVSGVNSLIPRAHSLLAERGLTASPAKVGKLVRAYVGARDSGAAVPPFDVFIVNGAYNTPLRPLRGARGHLPYVDETGETVARHLANADPTGEEARRRAWARMEREELHEAAS